MIALCFQRWGRTGCLLSLLSLLALVQADYFHHGHITWKICEDIFDGDVLLDAGFYDEAFPDVCRGARAEATTASARYIGVTIHAAFNTMHSVTSMIDPPSYANFLHEYNSGICALGKNCTIQMIATDGTTGDLGDLLRRRIGFKFGLQEDALHDTNMEFPPGIGDKYTWKVDRVSYDLLRADAGKYATPTGPYDAAADEELQGADPRYIYAHFSFHQQLNFDTDYTVYFEGCCRPRQERPSAYLDSFLTTDWVRPAGSGVNGDIYDPSSDPTTDMEGVFKAVCDSPGKLCMSNRVDTNEDPPNVPFYVYAELQVRATDDYRPSAPIQYPRASFKFESSNIVRLTTYGLPRCYRRSISNFAVHGYHPQSEFQGRVVYEMGDDLSRGVCLDVLRDVNTLRSKRCQGALGAGTRYAGLMRADIIQDSDIETMDGLGVVTVRNRIPGNFAVNVVVATKVGFGAQEVEWRSNMDFMLQVMEEVGSRFNDPPAPFFEDKVVEAQPEYSNPISIQCGTPTFFFGESQQNYLQFQYRDLDTSDVTCGLQMITQQEVELIGQSNNLPRGVSVSSEAMLGDPTFKYVNITWRPHCEQRSDLGMFKFCFGARDTADRSEHDNSLASLRTSIMDSAFSLQTVPTFSPDGYSADRWTKASECVPTQELSGEAVQYSCRNNPSCLFINVNGFPANPKPQLTAKKGSIEFSPPLFEDCNNVARGGNCNVGSTDELPTCLLNRDFCQAHTQAVAQGNEFEMTIFARSSNSIFGLSMSLTIEEYKCDGTTRQLVTTPIVPDISVPQYGCDGVWGSSGCSTISKVENQNDVGMQFKVIAPDAFESDSNGQIDKRALLVCTQVNQSIPSYVNRAEWSDLYRGETPNHDSCKSCFVLDLVPGPTINIDNPDPNFPGTQITDQDQVVTPFVAFVGVTKTIEVRTQGRLPNLEIMILADPGAPAHSKLEAYDVQNAGPVNGFYSSIRKFSFTPAVGQEGTKFLVKFLSRNEATNATGLFSNTLDIEITVMKFETSWAFTAPCMPVPDDYPLDTRTSGTCRTAGELQATVGCTQNHTLQIRLQPASTPGGRLSLGGELLEASRFLHRESFYIERLPSCMGENCPGDISVNSCGSGDSSACCGNGICDGAEMGSNCPEDCMPDDISLQVVPRTGDQASAQLVFSPNQHQLGRTLLICIGVRLNETFGGDAVLVQGRTATVSPNLCIKMIVAACKYCVPHGKTLNFVARYFLNLDWLRLYNSNPAITNPDGLIKERELFLGPQYTVEGGDTILSIAGTILPLSQPSIAFPKPERHGSACPKKMTPNREPSLKLNDYLSKFDCLC